MKKRNRDFRKKRRQALSRMKTYIKKQTPVIEKLQMDILLFGKCEYNLDNKGNINRLTKIQ